MDPNSLAEDLIAVTSRLSAILEQENKLLQAMKPARITTLQDDKVALANAYQALMLELARDPAPISQMEPILRLTVEKTLKQFNELANRNMNALRAAQEVNRRVMVTIVDAIKSQSTGQRGYGRTGRASAGDAGGRPISVSVNERL